jgi:hypothetical protein
MQLHVDSAPTAAEPAARILSERAKEVPPTDTPAHDTADVRFREAAIDGYELAVEADALVITAGTRRDFVAGAGELLRRLYRCAESGEPLRKGRTHHVPRFRRRVHYMPAHFGNSFECAWEYEMRRYLEDLALVGAAGYGDWFDPNDMPDPYHPHVFCSTSMSLWQRKKAVLRASAELGLENVLWVAHNVAFTDQLRPEWLGIRSKEHHVQGQVLCPSNPEARAVCLRNHDNLFRDLAESGVQVNRICYGPYDDGGCACPKCQPYYQTFLGMVAEIHEIVRRYFPDATADICGWWTTPEEFAQLAAFIDGPAREWFDSFQYSATYGVTEVPDLSDTLPGAAVSAFFHIAHSGDRRDVYLSTGIHSAPERIRSVVRSFEPAGYIGFQSYNESWGDHYNQFLVTRLAWDPHLSVEEVTDDYARQSFGLRGEARKEVRNVLIEMESLDASGAVEWFRRLEAAEPDVRTPLHQPWAFAHLIEKAQLLALDHRIGDGSGWTSPQDLEPVLPAIRERLHRTDRLWREVYGLGVLRHAFIPERMYPGWYPHYRRVCPEPTGRIRPGMAMSENA